MNCENIYIYSNFSKCNDTVVLILNSKTPCIRIYEILEAFYLKSIRFSGMTNSNTCIKLNLTLTLHNCAKFTYRISG